MIINWETQINHKLWIYKRLLNRRATCTCLEERPGDRHEGKFAVSKVKKVLVNDRRD